MGPESPLSCLVRKAWDHNGQEGVWKTQRREGVTHSSSVEGTEIISEICGVRYHPAAQSPGRVLLTSAALRTACLTDKTPSLIPLQYLEASLSVSRNLRSCGNPSLGVHGGHLQKSLPSLVTPFVTTLPAYQEYREVWAGSHWPEPPVKTGMGPRATKETQRLIQAVRGWSPGVSLRGRVQESRVLRPPLRQSLRALSSLCSLSGSSGVRALEFLLLCCQSLEKSRGWD